MRYALVAIASLALTSPAFAQQAQVQPRTPDDGVGVDYTQPYVNDLLLRSEPLMLGDRVGEGALRKCEPQLRALESAPDPETSDKLTNALSLCLKLWTEEDLRRFGSPPNGGLHAEPYRVQPGPPMRHQLPLAPSHPNAQN